jgi:hypothetical protein
MKLVVDTISVDRPVRPIRHFQAEYDNSNEEERDVERCNEYIHMASPKYID